MDRQPPAALFRLVRFVPEALRQRLVRLAKPSYTIGAGCLIEHDGRVLLVQPSYRTAWGLPGGLLNRRETPADGARREVFEEVGLGVELVGEPLVVIDPTLQKVDVLYRAALPAGSSGELALSTEIAAARWFDAAALPDLQPEAIDALAALRDGAPLHISSPR